MVIRIGDIIPTEKRTLEEAIAAGFKQPPEGLRFPTGGLAIPTLSNITMPSSIAGIGIGGLIIGGIILFLLLRKGK